MTLAIQIILVYIFFLYSKKKLGFFFGYTFKGPVQDFRSIFLTDNSLYRHFHSSQFDSWQTDKLIQCDKNIIIKRELKRIRMQRII